MFPLNLYCSQYIFYCFPPTNKLITKALTAFHSFKPVTSILKWENISMSHKQIIVRKYKYFKDHSKAQNTFRILILTISSFDICSETVWSIVSLCFFPRKWDNRCTSDKIYNMKMLVALILCEKSTNIMHKAPQKTKQNMSLNNTLKRHVQVLISSSLQTLNEAKNFSISFDTQKNFN